VKITKKHGISNDIRFPPYQSHHLGAKPVWNPLVCFKQMLVFKVYFVAVTKHWGPVTTYLFPTLNDNQISKQLWICPPHILYITCHCRRDSFSRFLFIFFNLSIIHAFIVPKKCCCYWVSVFFVIVLVFVFKTVIIYRVIKKWVPVFLKHEFTFCTNMPAKINLQPYIPCRKSWCIRYCTFIYILLLYIFNTP